MFSSKCYILFLSLAGYLGSHHHGLIQAKETQVISSMAIKTSLNVQIKSSTKMYGHRAAASFTTEPIYSTFHVPTEQITILETASASSENSKQPRSVTPHVYSLASHVVSSITVLTGASILKTSVQPSRAVLYSRNFTAIFPSNSTSFPQGSENSAIDDCSAGNVGEKSCDTYVTRWVDFYLNVSINTMHVRKAVLLIWWVDFYLNVSINTMHVRKAVLLIWTVIVYKYSILIFQGIRCSFESNFRLKSKTGKKRITLSISSKMLFLQIAIK